MSGCAGTINAIDAARKAGVKKLVLMTSLLTNAREAGQGLNPGFIFLNLFGGVLDAKLEARSTQQPPSAAGLLISAVRCASRRLCACSRPAIELPLGRPRSI